MLAFALPAFSEEALDKSFDAWDATNTFSDPFKGQKQVSDEQFDKTLEAIKEKAKNKKKWFWERKKPEVKPLCPVPQASQDSIKEFSELQAVFDKVQQTPTVMISAPVYDDNGAIIEPGYYKLSNIKGADGNYYFELSQGSTKFASILAHHTEEDFHQREINFSRLDVIEDRYIRIIYGNLDLNLEAYLKIKY